MHRFLTLLLMLGVLAGLLSGRFVHLQHHEDRTASDCGGQTAIEAVELLCSADTTDHGSTKETVCPDAHSGQCHHHACQHTISPGINVAALAFAPVSRVLGSVPMAPMAMMDEPVYELDTPPVI